MSLGKKEGKCHGNTIRKSRKNAAPVHADVFKVTGELFDDVVAHLFGAVFKQFLDHVVAIMVLTQIQIVRWCIQEREIECEREGVRITTQNRRR